MAVGERLRLRVVQQNRSHGRGGRRVSNAPKEGSGWFGGGRHVIFGYSGPYIDGGGGYPIHRGVVLLRLSCFCTRIL
jgi:hypothetical protein